MASLKFNINSTVRVLLTETGLAILQARHDRLLSIIPAAAAESLGKTHKYVPDKKGYYNFQLWQFMETFGPYLHMAMKEMPFDSTILFSEDEFEGSIAD